MTTKIAFLTAGEEGYDLPVDGFKIRNANDGHNGSGGTYLFAAFAESPFKTANAR